MTSRTVLVVGAGIAGSTLAYWLDRNGLRPTVLERAPELRRGGQNVDVRGPGRTVAARTGIEDAVRAAGTGEQGLAFIDDAGSAVGEFPVADGDTRDGFTAELEVLRTDLAQILYDATRDRVPYRFGDRVTSMDDDGTRVRVGFEHGPDEEFDLVVAADGIRSGTREIAMPGQADIRFLGVCLAYFTIPRQGSDTDWWRWYAAGAGRAVHLRPDGHGAMSALLSFLSLSPAAARLSEEAQKDLLRAEFAGAGWEAARVLDGMDGSSDFYFDALGQVRAPSYSTGRFGLVGDAAYCASPISGMGTTLALTGAYVLAGELGRHTDHRAAFASYEAIMKPYVQKVQKLPPGTPRLANPRSRTGVRLLNSAVHLAASPLVRSVTTRLPASSSPALELPDYDAVLSG